MPKVMQLRLKNIKHVRVFALTITVFSMILSPLIKYALEPPDVFYSTLHTGIIIPMMIAFPIAYFVGLKILDVHLLTVQLEHAVNHDNLTGACTRASLYQRVASMQSQQVVVVLADIDHFKSVNDRHGHKAGDTALKQFAATLVRNCREDDIVARFGGEEFVILLCDTKLSDGLLTAERLAEQVRHKPLLIDGQSISITSSFGVAEVVAVSGIDDAIHHADLAAYRAKREGRDRVCVFDPALDLAYRPGAVAE